MDTGQLGVNERIFGIVVESGFEQLTCFIHFAQVDERGGYALTEVIVDSLCSSDLFEKWTRFSGVFFQQELAREKPFDEEWMAMGQFAQLAFFKLGAAIGGSVLFGLGGA